MKASRIPKEKDILYDYISNFKQDEKKIHYLESNRRWVIHERSLELKERIKIQEKKNMLRSLIKYLKYFIQNKYHILNIDFPTFSKELFASTNKATPFQI